MGFQEVRLLHIVFLLFMWSSFRSDCSNNNANPFSSSSTHSHLLWVFFTVHPTLCAARSRGEHCFQVESVTFVPGAGDFKRLDNKVVVSNAT